jgi:hypothetical protein
MVLTFSAIDCTCVCVCVCVCVCIHTYVYTHIHTYIHTYVYTYIHTHTHTHTLTHTLTHTHTHTHTYNTHMCVNECMYVYINPRSGCYFLTKVTAQCINLNIDDTHISASAHTIVPTPKPLTSPGDLPLKTLDTTTFTWIPPYTRCVTCVC